MVTKVDVAKHAGVSPSTVTNVLTGRQPVSDGIKEKVLKSVELLGYRPNWNAQSLRMGRTHLLGVVADIHASNWVDDLAGLEKEATQRGYTVLPAPQLDDVEDAVRRLISFGVEGIVLLGGNVVEKIFADSSIYDEVKVPVVVSFFKGWRNRGSYVDCDLVGGAVSCIQFLWDLGHRRIGCLINNLNDRRALGYKMGLAQYGVLPEPEWYEVIEGSMAGGEEGIQRLLLRSPEITAVITYNDLVAIGALKGAKNIGRKIPQDLSVIGWDNLPVSNYVDPALTTIDIHKGATGAHLAKLLIEEIETGLPAPSVMMPAKLIKRDSTAPIHVQHD